MKKISRTRIDFLFFAISLLVNGTLFAQNRFQHSYGTKLDEVPFAFIQTNDKGYALVGTTRNDSVVYFVKVDSLGNKTWSKEYYMALPGGPPVPLSFIQTKDSGFVMCFSIYFTMKTNKSGAIQWVRSYNNESFNKIIETSGGYFFAGQNDWAMYMKTDFAGNVLWASDSNPIEEGIWDAMQLKYDSCFYMIMLGKICKVDKNGNCIWKKDINTKTIGYANTICADPDGKSIDCFLSSINPYYLIVIDTAGTVKRTLSFNLNFYSENIPHVYFTPGGANSNVFVCSTIDSTSGYPYSHMFVFNSDSVGNIKWSKKIGGKKQDYPAGILKTYDGGIAVFAATENFSYGDDDLYLIKMDSLGNGGCNQDTFHVNKLNKTTITLNSDFAFMKSSKPVNKYIAEGYVVIRDTDFNDCICQPPHAGFFYDRPSGYMFDSSRWAANWYWSFGDGTFDSAVSPKHQFPDTGIYNVCLKVKNACGVDSVCHTIDYQLPIPASVKNVTNSNMVHVYPNPSNGLFTVEQQGLRDKEEIEIYNMMGKLIYFRQLSNGSSQLSINISGQPTGIYLYRIISDKGELVASGKLVIE